MCWALLKMLGLNQGFSQKMKRAHVDWNTTVGVS
jgi:hypothetical protein